MRVLITGFRPTIPLRTIVAYVVDDQRVRLTDAPASPRAR